MKFLRSLFYVVCLFIFAGGSAHAAILVADNDNYGIPASRILTVEPFGVLENDTLGEVNAGEAGVTVTILTNVGKGALTCPDPAGPGLCADGSFEYIPDERFDGEDTFQYQADDTASGESATATVTLSACSSGPIIFSCWHETPFRAKLAKLKLGYNLFLEGFEGTAWDIARSPDTASEITSKNIIWTTNHPPGNEITTGPGPARTGQWGAFDPKHGLATETSVTTCDVDNPPVACRPYDGFSGSGTALHGVGGYFSGFAGANVAIILDGTKQGGGKLFDASRRFFGVIDTTAAGFTKFEFRELAGKVGQELLIFGDDFIIATTDSVAPNNPPELGLIGDQQVNENTLLTIELAATDIDDGDSLSFSMTGNPTGSTFSDNFDGTATFSWRPDLSQAGVYDLDFIVTDNGLPSATDSELITVTVVDVVDLTKPIIYMRGISPVNVELGAVYDDAGATADDNIDGPLPVTTNNPVNTDLEGTYTVTYDAMDAAGNAAIQVTRTVNVTPDVTKPVITLLGSNPINIELGTTYSDAGAKADDNFDGPLPVTTNNPVNISLEGIYIVTYDAMDAAGNTAVQVTRTVNVTPDVTKPVITLLGSSPVNIVLGTAYDDAGAKAEDNFDGDISLSITPTGAVDIWTAGSYTVTYNVSDAAGNPAIPVVRTVNVTITAGDINGNGTVGLEDMIMVLQTVTGLTPLTIHLEADVNGDGRIGVIEAIFILRKVAGLP